MVSSRWLIADDDDSVDSMKTLLLHESVNQAWGARDRRVARATEHVALTGSCAKEAESWALQPGAAPEWSAQCLSFQRA